MKTIIEKINEGFSSPDVFYIKNGPSINWKVDNAYPFFYNSDNGIVTLSDEPKTTHASMLVKLADGGKTNFVKHFGLSPEDMISKDAMIDGVYSSKAAARGRVWMLPTRELLSKIHDEDIDEARSTEEVKMDKKFKNMFTLVIAWWDDLTDKQYKEGCEAVIKKVKEDVNKFLDVPEYYFIDSHGDWELIEIGSDKEFSTANLQSDEEKTQRKILKAIHLASQKEKDEFYRPWKDAINKAKDKELQKLGWKDSDRCYAKRNDKFAKHIVRDEKNGKYKVVYGAKIGDSLEMNTILNKIYEYATPDDISDTLEYINSKGERKTQRIVANFRNDSARAFMINIKNKKIAMGKDANDWHYRIIDNDIDDARKKMNFGDNYWSRRMEKGETKKEFYEECPEMKNIRCGRLWDFRKGDDDGDVFDMIVIGWWEPLTSKQYSRFTKIALDYYSEKFDKIDYDKVKICAVDNNCKLFIFDPKQEDLKVVKRTKEAEQAYGIAKAIHLASQKEKDKFYRPWKDAINKAKDKELQKLGWKNSDRCYAKRNDKFSKHVVKDEKTGKYKVVYGTKLGDSLVDFVKNFVNE